MSFFFFLSREILHSDRVIFTGACDKKKRHACLFCATSSHNSNQHWWFQPDTLIFYLEKNDTRLVFGLIGSKKPHVSFIWTRHCGDDKDRMNRGLAEGPLVSKVPRDILFCWHVPMVFHMWQPRFAKFALGDEQCGRLTVVGNGPFSWKCTLIRACNKI